MRLALHQQRDENGQVILSPCHPLTWSFSKETLMLGRAPSRRLAWFGAALVCFSLAVPLAALAEEAEEAKEAKEADDWFHSITRETFG